MKVELTRCEDFPYCFKDNYDKLEKTVELTEKEYNYFKFIISEHDRIQDILYDKKDVKVEG